MAEGYTQSSGSGNPVQTPEAAFASGFEQGLNVTAQAGASSQFASAATGADGSAIRVPMLYVDPLFDTILILFPQDNIRESNRRVRHYYKYQPYVRSAIDFHVETMLSDFWMDCGNPEYKEAQDFYNDFKERKNLLDVITDVVRDYWLLGEGFSFGNWNDFDDEFEDFVQIPPEEIEVHSAYVTNRRVYVLRPNTELGKLMSSANVADRQLAQYIRQTNPEQAEKLLRNKPYKLDSSRLITLQRKMAAYSNRGISPVISVVKDLLYEDQLNMFRTVFLQRHSFPMKMFKIGDREKGWIPPASMYLEFRRQLLASVADPDYNLITHPFVNVEYVTGQDKILNLPPLYDHVKARVFIGLMVNDAILGGAKGPYSDGLAFMRGVMHRYLSVRNNLNNELIRKVFFTLARMKDFTAPTQAQVSHRVKSAKGRKLILPKIFWHKTNLLASNQMIQMILSLRERGDVPLQSVTDLLGWNFDQMLSQLKHEESTYADKSWRTLKEKFLGDNKEMRKDSLAGKKIDEILKKNYKEEAKKPEAQKEKGRKAKDFVMPAVAEPKEPVLTEGGGEGEGGEPAPEATGAGAGEGETPTPAPGGTP